MANHIAITPHGWTITQQPGVFRRGGSTAPTRVEPQADGQVAEVLPFLPPMSVARQLLVQVHLVTCPNPPH